MKNTIRIIKTIIAIVLSILMVVGTMSVAFAANVEVVKTGDAIADGSSGYYGFFVDVSSCSWWQNNNCYQALYIWNGDVNQVVPGKKFAGSNVYYFRIPYRVGGWTNFIEFRTGSENPTSLAEKYNQTADGTFSSASNYCYSIGNDQNQTPKMADLDFGLFAKGDSLNWATDNYSNAVDNFIGDAFYNVHQFTPQETKNYGYKLYSTTWKRFFDAEGSGSGDGSNATVSLTAGKTYNITVGVNLSGAAYVIADEINLSSYKLKINDGTAIDFINNKASVELEEVANKIVVEKYVSDTLDSSYYLPSSQVGESFSEVSLVDTANDYTFTPSESGKYSFILDSSSMKLSANKSSSLTFSFQDNTSNNWIYNDDADIWITSDNGTTFTLMNETIDEYTGLRTWAADIAEPSDGEKVYFVRGNRLYRSSASSDKVDSTDWADGHSLGITQDGNYTYNVWEATYDTTSGQSKNRLFRATDDGVGEWIDGSAKTPSGSASDFYWGIYCDTKGNGDTKDFVKMYTSEPYVLDPRPSNFTLFLPSYTNLDKLNIYTTFYDCTIQGNNYSNPTNILRKDEGAMKNTLRLQTGKEYKIKYKNSIYEDTSKELNLTVYRSNDTASMFMNTSQDLYSKTTLGLVKPNGKDGEKNLVWAGAYKGSIEDKGSYKFFDESGSQLNANSNIKKIKGRGNSSWEASMERYGKYAYNINLKEKDPLIEGAATAKKYCLMANNMDESAVRNTLIYGIAEEAGSMYAPKTRLIDLFDNGNYLGSYIIAEKVEYGKNTLIAEGTKGKVDSMDSYNEDTADAAGIDYEALVRKTDTYNGYEYQYNAYDEEDVDVYNEALTDFENFDYVMEFELEERYSNEASWIKTPNGQHICMKYPEFASQNEMKYFIDQIAPVWNAVYVADNFDTYKDLIDVNSFAKTYLIQELAQNLDAAATSYYITGGAHFDKLVAAPLWDYDWAVGDYYYTKKITSGSDKNMDNPEQMFVKDKSMNTGSDHHIDVSTPCFESQLARNTAFYDVCKDEWTNNFVPALNKYIDNGWVSPNTEGNYTPSKLLLTDIYEHFKSSMVMNEARWHQMHDLLTTGPTSTIDWGTKSTSNYKPQSYYFNVGNGWASSTEIKADENYVNTLYYLNDWLAKRWNYMSSSDGGALWDQSKKYDINSVEFTATQGSEPNTKTLTLNTISVDAKNDERTLENSEITINVYVNGKVKDTFVLSDFNANTVELSAGENDVYVEAVVTAHDSTKCSSSKVHYTVSEEGATVDLTIRFKTCDSYRYIPFVNDVEMVKGTSSDSYIGHNNTYTQQFYWYDAIVEAKIGSPLTLNFTNSLKMNATFTIENVEYKPYYFGVDNLNDGKVAEDITNNDSKKNVCGNATCMISNLPDEANIVSFTPLFNLNGSMYYFGDVNKDGNFNIVDCTLYQRGLAELTDLDDDAYQLGDFTMTGGEQDICNVTAMQKRLANLQ